MILDTSLLENKLSNDVGLLVSRHRMLDIQNATVVQLHNNCWVATAATVINYRNGSSCQDAIQSKKFVMS